MPIIHFESKTVLDNVKQAIKDLLEKKAIETCKNSKNQFLSSYFLIQKPDGSYRFILNLKRLNEFIFAEHFKLEDIKTAINLVSPGDFMAHIDLQDAYFLVPVHKKSRKYLRFEFSGKLYQFTCLPFGLNVSPRIFTKIMKSVINYLRLKGWKSIVYLDDFLCVGDNFENCKENVKETITVLESLGFVISYKKSNLIPERRCKFLGFIIDTKKFTLELPDEKRVHLINLVSSFYNKQSCLISEFAMLIGKLIAACPAVDYGWLYTKKLEREKLLALLFNDGDYRQRMPISRLILSDLDWWKSKLRSAYRYRMGRYRWLSTNLWILE